MMTRRRNLVMMILPRPSPLFLNFFPPRFARLKFLLPCHPGEEDEGIYWGHVFGIWNRVFVHCDRVIGILNGVLVFWLVF